MHLKGIIEAFCQNLRLGERECPIPVGSPSAATSLFRYFRQQGWHGEEPGDPYPSEEPQRLTRLVLRALAEDLITESRAPELLGRPLGEPTRTEGEKHARFPSACVTANVLIDLHVGGLLLPAITTGSHDLSHERTAMPRLGPLEVVQ